MIPRGAALRAPLTPTAILVVAAGCGLLSPDDRDGPLEVESVLPADGTTGVSIHAAPTVLFSDFVVFPVDADAFTLEAGDVDVAGSIQRLGGDSVAFVPTFPLEFATTYTATLTTVVVDTAGDALEREHRWSFTTLGAPPPALSETNILGHIAVLAHDSLQGRGSGTVDEYRAATYLRAQFQALGLTAGIADYLQTFEPATGMTSQNVLAVLPGEGSLSDKWVVVGAHYDHVGLDGMAQIRNGADDNASGTALVLELARALHDYVTAGGTGGEARRSFLFAAFGAEELGLVGSRHYCANPTVPMASVVAMLNFDMVGRLRGDSLIVVGLWTSPQWTTLLNRYDPTLLTLIDKRDCQSCSDYACFRHAGRPAIWLFTGFHPQYHGPDDDVELVDLPGMVTVGTLSLRTLIHLAVRPEALPFGVVTPAGPVP